MNKSDLVKWAIRGLRAEMNDCEKAMQKGYEYIRRMENGDHVPTDKSLSEIMVIIKMYHDQIEQLSMEIYNLKWELSFDDTYEMKGE